MGKFTDGYLFGKEVITDLGTAGIEEVKRQIEEAKDLDAYDDFDKGIEAAFLHYEEPK
jgi:hypothetical protein